MSKPTFETWLSERPRWMQTAAVKLLESQRRLDANEIKDLADLCIAETSKNPVEVFRFVPKGTFDTANALLNLRLSKIEKVKGVNAIRSNAELDLGNKDFAIIYGPNGAGKSGFARLVKNACGARTSADLLPNVFEKQPTPPSACFLLLHNDTPETVEWNAAAGPSGRLRWIHVFDSAVATSYVSDKNAASYEPRRMRFISRLIEASELVSAELTRRKDAVPRMLPQLPAEHTATQAGSFWLGIKPSTTQTAIDAQCSWTQADTDERLRLETILKQQDIGGRLRELSRQKKLLAQLESEVKTLRDGLTDAKLLPLLKARKDAQEKRKAASEDAARIFANAPLEGVGTESWRLMWQQARQYSEALAYPNKMFPVVHNPADKCVLCQQPLDAASRDRLSGFEAYVKGGLETAARTSEKLRDTLTQSLPVLPTAAKWRLDVGLIRIEPAEADSLYERIRTRRAAAETIIDPVNLPALEFQPLDEAIESLKEALGKEETALTEMQRDGQRLEHEKTLKELRGREWITQQKTALETEIKQRAICKKLEDAAKLASTHALTRKKNELMDEELAKGYQERFLAEMVALGGKRLSVSLEPLQEGKGRISFKLKLCDTQQDAAAHSVLSEGESRIVALAAFLADIGGSGQQTPFVFDDPISSLDQEFEERVADRLVELSRTRQVIVFTHRLSLLSILDDALEKVSKNVSILAEAPPSRSFLSLRRLGPVVGVVNTLDVRREPPAKGFAKLRGHRLPILRRAFDALHESYESEMKAACSDFRILVERSVEKVMLAGLIERFRRSVQTQQIRSLAKITPADCILIDRMMTKYSGFEHSQSDEIDARLPEIDEVAMDLDLMIDWISEFDKRAVA
ncbi:energy-coupling factor transporter ATP-binding protein EcfA2 [Robbsia andropogonis]|uniref:AAA family ATPase n=1 Tax=Robbsia andropogonis TaxID=28092 RepID=UPI003D1ADD99